MRCRFAQIAIVAAVCLLADDPHVQAQDSPCPTHSASASGDKRPSGREISVAEVTFSGSRQMPTLEQDEIAASIKQRTYGNSLDGVTDEAVETVKAGWQDHGYFKVRVGGEERTLTSSPANWRIALSFHVDEGFQYKLDGITFKHNKAIRDVSALRGLFPINDGDIFSRGKIRKGLQNLSKAYQQIGYIDFTSVPDTTVDDENKLISLDIDMDEGQQFYVSSVDILGLDEQARQKLLKELPIKRGQIYNSRLWELSLQKYSSMLPGCECRYYEPPRLDEKTGTVALTLGFRPCSND